MNNFEKALAETLEKEGFFSNDPEDNGGKTTFGITEKVARAHGYLGEMKALPINIAEEIYKKDYWDINRLDDISEYDEALAIEMFDIAVNMGAQLTAKNLQRSINCLNRGERLFPDLKVDGLIRSKTLMALNKLKNDIDKQTLFKMLNVLQGAQYIKLCEIDKKQEKFVRGWFKRVSFKRIL